MMIDLSKMKYEKRKRAAVNFVTHDKITNLFELSGASAAIIYARLMIRWKTPPWSAKNFSWS